MTGFDGAQGLMHACYHSFYLSLNIYVNPTVLSKKTTLHLNKKSHLTSYGQKSIVVFLSSM